MNAVALQRSPRVRARRLLLLVQVLLVQVLIATSFALPVAANAHTLELINGDVTQQIPVSDLHAISDTTFTLYDPYQGREVEMQGVAFQAFLIDQFGEIPPALHFTAWDDYEVTLSNWDDPNWYLITLEDGEPLSLRQRGPIRLVERDYGNRDVENLREFNDWVWMIRRIEVKW